jgi:hypothetical protein
MFENVALRKIFGPKREKVTGDWRKQHNEQLRGLYCSRNIQVAKSGRMSLGGGGMEFWWGNLKEREYLEEIDVDGKVLLK